MGCISSTAASGHEQIRTGEKKELLKGYTGAVDGSTGGKTLLRAHTSGLDGGSKIARMPADGHATSEYPEPEVDAPVDDPVTQDIVEEAAADRSINPNPDEAYIREYLSVCIATQPTHDDKEGCREVSQALVFQNANADTPKHDDKEGCREVSQSIVRQNANANFGKACDQTETENQRRGHQEEECAMVSRPVLFVKGDFISIVGPTATGNTDLQGKSGRIINVDAQLQDTNGEEIPYEVLVGQAQAWFKPSSLAKSQAFSVIVSGGANNDATWCSGNSGILRCCTDVPR